MIKKIVLCQSMLYETMSLVILNVALPMLKIVMLCNSWYLLTYLQSLASTHSMAWRGCGERWEGEKRSPLCFTLHTCPLHFILERPVEEAVTFATCSATKCCICKSQEKLIAICNATLLESDKIASFFFFSSFFSLTTLQLNGKKCECVTPPLQLAMFVSDHHCIASCKENCLMHLNLSTGRAIIAMKK